MNLAVVERVLPRPVEEQPRLVFRQLLGRLGALQRLTRAHVLGFEVVLAPLGVIHFLEVVSVLRYVEQVGERLGFGHLHHLHGVSVCCGMSVRCVLYLLLDYMGWWSPVCCGMSVHGVCCTTSSWTVPPPGRYGVVGTGVLWDVSTLCVGVPPAGLYGVVGAGELDVKHCVL